MKNNPVPPEKSSLRKLQLLLLSSLVAMSSAPATTSDGAAELFNPTHGVILSGSEGKAIAEACGGTSSAARSTLTPIDIGRVERQLAPLLPRISATAARPRCRSSTTANTSQATGSLSEYSAWPRPRQILLQSRRSRRGRDVESSNPPFDLVQVVQLPQLNSI
jgi:hypothetical protein